MNNLLSKISKSNIHSSSTSPVAFKFFFKIIINVILPIIFIWLIYNQLGDIFFNKLVRINLQNIFNKAFSIEIILFVLILFVLNLAIEVKKWHLLNQPISYWYSFKCVSIGMFVSIFTPARVGEFGGRLYLMPKARRAQALYQMLLCSFSQNISILTLGLIGTFYIAEVQLKLDPYVKWIFIFFIIFGIVSLVFAYLNLHLILENLKKLTIFPIIGKNLTKYNLISTHSIETLLQTLLFSFCRTLVWLFQYLCIMYLLGDFNISLVNISAILSIFLFQTGIPLPFITGLIARGSIAIFIWKCVGITEIHALCGTLILYFLNLCLPSIIGMTFLISNRKINE